MDAVETATCGRLRTTSSGDKQRRKGCQVQNAPRAGALAKGQGPSQKRGVLGCLPPELTGVKRSHRKMDVKRT